MNKAPRILIKLGGAALQAATALEGFIETLRHCRDLGYKVIVVHGGGPAINQELTRRGITWQFVGGQRVTTPAMMDVIESTLCGVVNRRLVRALGAAGLPVVGFSGVDHQTLLCKQASVELGQVGSIQKVNATWIEHMLTLPSGLIPMIAPLGVDAGGESYNINADWSASHLAVALGVEQLLFITDQTGIMDEEGQIIPEVTASGLQNMIDCKVVSGGMLTKSRAVLHALGNGIPTVRILNVKTASFDVPNGKLGTSCVADPAVSVAKKIAAGFKRESSHVAV
jgi:acetylglutamate kinase